jgi:anionic cell wall polymer biosynthesis LytR-Cps2A-Psr (LCP) family protein
MNIGREKKSIIFLVLILVIIVVLGVVIALSLRTDPVAENLKNDQVIKILFVLNDGNKHALTTDVFVYYPVSQKGALFDILGNTGAIYECLKSKDGRNGRVDRIDAVYTECGIDTYRSEIEKLTELTIPFSVEMSLSNFGSLTDLLGGMKVFVPSPVDASGENGERWLLPSGAVTLDGDKIQTYVQYMLPDESESDREDRRQNVMIAFLAAIKDNKSVLFTKKNFSSYSSKMNANIDNKGLYRLLDEISDVDSERLSPQTITGSIRVVDGKKLLFPYYDGQLIKDVVKQTMNSLVSENGTMQSRVYVIDIQNGTPTQGLARNTSALLQSVGYDVLGTSNADRSDYERTVIINHIGNKEVADALGGFIHCENIQEEAVKPEEAGVDSAADVDFTIILGKDFDGRYVRGNYKGTNEDEQPAQDAKQPDSTSAEKEQQ